MKIYDETLTTELESPDLTLGRLESARRLVAHHNAVERQYHYEVMEGTVTDECPEGLRREVEDVAAAAAWDEYEDVQRYVIYTDTELAEMAAKAQAEKAAADAAAKAAEQAAKEAEDRRDASEKLNAQVTYTAMMTDTMLPEEG
jgi:multidrug efflux pump subunit AcrA (membrane-fusion protein)